MITRSFSPEVLRKAAEPYPDILKSSFDFEGWVNNHNNILLVEDDDVGFFTYEYPGVYTAHYFLKSRGRDALNVTLRAFKQMFEEYGAESLRGLTKTNLKAARWMARQYGFKSYGIDQYPSGEYELFIMTKQEFYENLEHKGYNI